MLHYVHSLIAANYGFWTQNSCLKPEASLYPSDKFHSVHQQVRMQTIRQKIIDLLSLQEMNARQLSAQIGIREREAVEQLGQKKRSRANKGKKLTIRPAECLLCG